MSKFKIFKAEVRVNKAIRELPRVKGWEGGKASWMIPVPDCDGKRTNRAPTLAELDGSND